MVPFRMLSWVQRSLGLRPRFRRIRRRKIAGLNHGAMAGHVIQLEARVLPAAVTNVADLNGDPDHQNDSSNPREFTTIGTKTFFTYNTQVTNKPILAFTDSQTGVTTTLPDQTNFRFSPNTQISELTAYTDPVSGLEKLYFVATDGNASMGFGQELWSLDPASINANTGAATFTCITDGVSGANVELPNGTFKVDANGIKIPINGVQQLTNGTTTINSKNEGSAPANLTVVGTGVNAKLYFTASDDLTGQGGNRELYYFDGTKLKFVRDINANPTFASGSSTPLQLTDAGGLLYFTAIDTATNGRELWRTNGTDTGTFLLANIKPTGDGDVTEITPAITLANPNRIFFSANNGSTGNELWQSDGTVAGTSLVKDIQGTINGVNQGSNPSSLLFANGKLYFAADDGLVGKELWIYDPAVALTNNPGDPAQATSNPKRIDIAQTGPNGVFDVKQNSDPHNLTYVQETGLIYFSANDGKEGFELWSLNPANNTVAAVQTTAGALNAQHPIPGINRTLTSTGDQTGGSFPGSLLNVGGVLYFVATNTYDQNGQTNFELWRVNASGVIEKAGLEINQLSNDWQSQFDIPDPQQDFTYAKSTADAFRPTEVIADASPNRVRENASNRQLFLGPDGLIYFAADNGANGSKGTSFFGPFFGLQGALGEYNPNVEPHAFNAGPNGFNTPLPASNASGLVKDMTVQSLVSTEPFGFTTVGTRTYFFFRDTRLSSRNFGLAYFDSSLPLGSQTIDSGLRFDSVGTNARPNPQVFGGNTILFIANGKEVWRTDGTQSGTEAVATADVSIDLLTVSGNRYFYYGFNHTFSGNTRSSNGELWSGTDGAEAAEQVIEIAPTVQNVNRSAGISFIVPAGGNSVWFDANDFGNPNNGNRDGLWISNGTTDNNGTRFVVSGGALAFPANPTGPQGPDAPYAAAATPDTVYFAAGTTLYRSRIIPGTNGPDQAAIDAFTVAISPSVGTISQITVVTDGVYFVAGTTLYFSDAGNPANTVVVHNGFSTLSNLTAVGNRLYFVSGGTELYTATATPAVPPVPGPAAPATSSAAVSIEFTPLFNIHSLVLSGTRLYFSARSSSAGQELWTSLDGSNATQVTDVRPGNTSSLTFSPDFPPHSEIGVGNGLVWFGANDLTLGEALHSVPDGSSTLTGATRRADIVRPTTASSNARDFIILDIDTYGGSAQPTVYFFSDVGPQRSVLSAISTNPFAPASNVTLTTIDTYRNWGHVPGDLVFFDDISAVDTQIESVPFQYEHFGEYGHPLDPYGIYKSGNTATANFNGYLGVQYLFFSGFNSDNTGGQNPFNYGQELYVLYQGGAVRLTDLRVASNTAQGNSNPGYLTSIGNNADGESNFVLFAASSGSSDGALYKVTTTNQAPATFPVGQISSALNPRYLQSLGGGEGTGGLIYFTAGPETARTAWVTDGFTAVELSTAIVDESAGDGNIFGFANGKVYFSAREASSNSDNFELYMTDHAQLAVTTGHPNFNNEQTRLGTNVTGLLKEISASPTAGSRPGNFTNVNGVMYFAANDGTHGFELWKTDGTPNGTVLVQDIEPGAAGSNPGVVVTPKTTTDLNGVSTTSLVYTYQGFTVGNTRPDEFGATNAGVNVPGQNNPAKPNSGDDTGTPTLMFAATTTTYGRELWQVTPNSFVTTIYFATETVTGVTHTIEGATYDALSQTATFIFNGVPRTLTNVADISAGTPFNQNGVDYVFRGLTYTGTQGALQLVKDIAPGARSSNPVNLTTLDGTVYFSADDGLSGDTLWQSVGLDQLTGNTLTRKMTDDLELSATNSALVNGIRNPNDFTLLTTNNKTINRLIYTAANDLGKTELYQLNINHTPTALTLSSNAVQELQPLGTEVGKLQSDDPDFGDTFQYKFVAGAGDTDNDKFEIVGTSLQIKEELDFEFKSTYLVRIRTTDQRGQFYERTFTVNVSDVNEAPDDLRFLDPTTDADMNDNARIDEIPSVSPANPPATTQDILLANLASIENDAITASNVYSIVPGQLDASSFVLDTRNGRYQLFLKAGAVLNFENKGIYEVNVQIVDPSVAGSTPVVRKFTLTLNDLNEAPIGAVNDDDSDVNEVLEGAPTGTTVGITALAIDPDTQLNPVTYSLDDNAFGRFQITNTVDGLGRRVGVVSVLNGSLINYEAAIQHTIIVRATSSDGTTSTAPFVIQVNDRNEFAITQVIDVNPTPNSTAINSVLEHSPIGTPVGLTAFAVDQDGNPLGTTYPVTYTLTSDAGGRFTIDSDSGVVTVANSALLDREQTYAWSVTVQAASPDGTTSQRPFTIFLTDFNEFLVGDVVDVNSADNRVLEGVANGTPVGITARAVDDDATNNVVTYALTSNAGGRFKIDSASGIITVANGALIDREQAAAWSVTVQATSQDGSTSDEPFTIFIDDVNEFAVGPVSDVNNALNAVIENAPNGTPVGITAKATDADATAAVTYELLDNAGGRFAIDENTGVVTLADSSLLDREAPLGASHSITVQAKSTDGTTSQLAFTITVGDFNEFNVGPITNVFSPANATAVTIPEHSPIGMQVGITAQAVDDDATNNKVTYTLTNSAGGRFAINPFSGVVTVANSALIDREVVEMFGITVEAKSQDGSTISRPFTIILTDVNDNQVSDIVDTNPTANATVGGTVFNGSVIEKAATGTVVAITAFATDPDFSNIGFPMTYSLQDTSAGRYKIDPVTGVVTVDDGTRIDFETGPSNIIVVRATAQDGSFKTKSFVIKVQDLSETPTLTISSSSVNENMPVGTAVGIFGVTDATPTSPVYTLVSGTGATNNSSFQIVGNQLRTKAKFNFESKSSYSVRVRMTSSNGVTAIQVFTITVNNLNEAPTNVTLSKTSVPRNSVVGTQVGLLSGTDPDAGSTFTYSLVPGTGSTDNAKFAIVGNQLRVNAPLGTASRASIRVRVTDQFGQSFEKTFSISLTN